MGDSPNRGYVFWQGPAFCNFILPGLSFQTEVENQSDDGWTAGEPYLASSALPSVLQLIVLLSFLSLVKVDLHSNEGE